jgi:hypothetical protein
MLIKKTAGDNCTQVAGTCRKDILSLESQIVAFVRQGNFERISATATAAEVGRFDERLTIDEDLKGRDIGRVTMLYSLKIAIKRSPPKVLPSIATSISTPPSPPGSRWPGTLGGV